MGVLNYEKMGNLRRQIERQKEELKESIYELQRCQIEDVSDEVEMLDDLINRILNKIG